MKLQRLLQCCQYKMYFSPPKTKSNRLTKEELSSIMLTVIIWHCLLSMKLGKQITFRTFGVTKTSLMRELSVVLKMSESSSLVSWIDITYQFNLVGKTMPKSVKLFAQVSLITQPKKIEQKGTRLSSIITLSISIQHLRSFKNLQIGLCTMS